LNNLHFHFFVATLYDIFEQTIAKNDFDLLTFIFDLDSIGPGYVQPFLNLIAISF